MKAWQPSNLTLPLLAMTAHLVTPRCTVLFLLLAVAGGGWCQTQLLDPEPRTCRTQDNAADASTLSQGRRNEYPAGGVLMVLAKVPAGLFGSLEVYLCPEGDAEVECLDRVPLQLADGSGTSYSLEKVPRTDRYEIPVLLPDDITCPTCTLQLRVLTRDCDDEEEDCPETEDTFCSDITVRDIKTPRRRGLTGSRLATVGRGMTILGRCMSCIGSILVELDVGGDSSNGAFISGLVNMICSAIEQRCTQTSLAIEATPDGGKQDSEEKSKSGKGKNVNKNKRNKKRKNRY